MTIKTAPYKQIFSTWDLQMNFAFTVNHLRALMQAQRLGRTVVLFPEVLLERNFLQIPGNCCALCNVNSLQQKEVSIYRLFSQLV